MGEMNNNLGRVVYSNGTSSLGTPSRDIETPHFCGASSPVNVTLTPTPYKSLLESAPTFGFRHHPNYLRESATASDFAYSPEIKMIGKEPYATLRTSGNNFTFPASKLIDQGFFSPVYHVEDFEIQRWRDVTEKDNTVSYIKPAREGRLIEGPERLAYFDPRDTPLRKFVTPVTDYEGPNNLFGKYISMNENFRQNIRNVLFDPTHRTRYDADTVDFIDFLTKKYDAPRKIAGIGTEKMGAVARIYSGNKNSYIVGSTDFYEKAKAMAEAYGLSGREAIEFVKRAIMYHELVHNAQPGMSERDAEIDAGETLHEYFIKKAKDLEGTEEGRIYKILAAAERVYAESWRRSGKRNAQSKSKSKNLESKVRELTEEAESLGLEGDEARDYIRSRLDEESEDRERSDLEERVNEADRKYENIDDVGNEEYNNREMSNESNEAIDESTD